MQQKLPNSTTVLVLGIVSIVFCWCYGIVGLITGLIGLNLYKKDNALHLQNPGQYSGYETLKTGRILCIIGLALSVLYLIYFIFLISTVGFEALTNPALMQEKLKGMGIGN